MRILNLLRSGLGRHRTGRSSLDSGTQAQSATSGAPAADLPLRERYGAIIPSPKARHRATMSIFVSVGTNHFVISRAMPIDGLGTRSILPLRTLTLTRCAGFSSTTWKHRLAPLTAAPPFRLTAR